MMHKKLPKLDLNITNRCNFRCAHCAFDSGICRMKEMTVSELEKILADTKKLGGERIDITGGEPTIRKGLHEIIKAGKALSYKIELVTNGSLLEKEDLQQFKALGLDSIAVSLDGISSAVYNRIRGMNGKTFRKAKETICTAIAMGFPVKVNTIACEENLHEITKISEWCIDAGAIEHGLYYYTPVGRGARSGLHAVEPVKWLKFIRKELPEIDSRIKLTLEVPLIEADSPLKETGCILEEDPYHLQILPDGNVYPCAILASYGKAIGNLHDTPVTDIWNNKLKPYARQIHEEVFEKFKGSCVDFGRFSIEEYKARGYRFVCPLRKFRAKELTASL